MAKVTKDTMIGELLQIDANVAPLLLNIGMHCLGCPSSQMETIGEAAMVHGIDADDLVKDINDFIRIKKDCTSVQSFFSTKSCYNFARTCNARWERIFCACSS